MILDEWASQLWNLPQGQQVVIEGYTDEHEVGSEEESLALADRRAQAVRSYLVQQGVDESRLSVVSFGESRPVASNDTPEGRARNRRAELRVLER